MEGELLNAVTKRQESVVSQLVARHLRTSSKSELAAFVCGRKNRCTLLTQGMRIADHQPRVDQSAQAGHIGMSIPGNEVIAIGRTLRLIGVAYPQRVVKKPDICVC